VSTAPGDAPVQTISPDWPAPPAVRAAFTLRMGGVSAAPFDSLNLGAHVGDTDAAVTQNRRRVRTQLRLPAEPLWLEQVHGIEVADLDAARGGAPHLTADAAIARRAASVCAIQVADCMPVLFASEDGGRTYAVMPGLPQMSEMTALVAIPGSADILAAVIDGQAMISHDGGRSWRNAGFDGAGAPVDTIATDATRPQRIWAAAGGRIVVSDDLGSGWYAVGRSLPEARTRVRGIAASADATTLVVSSDRGIYRSEDGGETWTPKADNLPTHIEAGPLARDPNDAGVIYTVFSLVPYAEVWRMAIEGGNLLARIEPISLAGGLSFCVLVLIGGGLAAWHLSRRRAAAHSPR